MSDDTKNIDAAIIASVVGRRFEDMLRESDVDADTIEELGFYASVAAIPVVRVVLESDDPVEDLTKIEARRAEIEALEGMWNR